MQSEFGRYLREQKTHKYIQNDAYLVGKLCLSDRPELQRLAKYVRVHIRNLWAAQARAEICESRGGGVGKLFRRAGCSCVGECVER